MNDNNMYRPVHDGVACLVIALDEQRTIRQINRFGLQLLGYERADELLGMTLDRLLAPDGSQRAELERLFATLDEASSALRCEADLVRRDGLRLALSLLLLHGSNVDASGLPPAAPIVVCGFDASGPCQLPDFAAMLCAVTDAYSGSIVIADARQHLIYVNPAALRHTLFEADGERAENERIETVRDRSGQVRYRFSIGEDLAQRQRHRQTIENLLVSDALTGLPNRLAFARAVVAALDDARRQRYQVTLVHVDIDDFVLVNDALGVDQADSLIAQAASCIKRTLRQTDLLARLGNDKFGIVFGPHADDGGDHISELCARVLAAISAGGADGTSLSAERTVQVTASIGVASYPLDGEDAGELLSRAMLATERAKSNGGNRWCRFDAGSAGAINSRRELLGALRVGVECRQLVLHYQPQLSLSSGAVVGVEALIRWQHPQRGLVPPGEFIPLVEDSQQIVDIGNWTLREACRQMRAWADAGLPPIKVAVNLAARHFVVAELAPTIAALLAEYRISPQFLEIEITEGAMMLDVAAAIRSTEQLKAIGVRLSLDDFGTGYSSLAYLSRFPIDVVKIDQSFVHDITSNPANAAIAQAMIAMSHKLGKVVLAEGVETEEQMHYLRRNECDEMQGYFFSKPLPADAIDGLLRNEMSLDFALGEGAPERDCVLFVDDEASILATLKRILRREGYLVLTAQSAAEGYALLARNVVHVVVSDQHMPGIKGTEFLASVKTLYPETVRMVLSGKSDFVSVTDSINRGAVYRFLNKPWDEATLKREIAGALRHWRESYGPQRDEVTR